MQVRPGVSFEFLSYVGQYVADHRPAVVVQVGDFADFESLSSYDRGKRCFEGRRYKKDVDAAVKAMDTLTKPFRNIKGYRPEMHLTLGNHENRVDRAIDEDAKLEGLISLADLQYEKFGWTVHDFLKPVVIDGVSYVHYVTTGAKGNAASSASAILREVMGSAVVGHNQLTDVAVHKKTGHVAIMAGVCNEQNEPYLGNQGNNYRRQIWVLNEVKDGRFDFMNVSLAYLRRRYGS